MLNYTYTTKEEGKSLIINKDNDIIIMHLHPDVEGHIELIAFLEDENNLKKYVNYLSSNPNTPFNLEEILSL